MQLKQQASIGQRLQRAVHKQQVSVLRVLFFLLSLPILDSYSIFIQAAAAATNEKKKKSLNYTHWFQPQQQQSKLPPVVI
jgi:hypothetical protein